MAPPLRTSQDTTLRPARPISINIPEPPRTDRLTLRPLTESDRPAFLAVVRANAAYLDRWLPLHEPDENDDAFFDRQLSFCTEGDAKGTAWRRLAVLEDGSIAGCFNLNSISRGLAWEADAVWWIAEAHAGKGLASEGLSAMLNHAFEMMPSGLGLHGVHCGIEPGNDASKRVAQKCGFVHKPDRQSYLKIRERWVMHDFYMATPGSVGQ